MYILQGCFCLCLCEKQMAQNFRLAFRLPETKWPVGMLVLAKIGFFSSAIGVPDMRSDG